MLVIRLLLALSVVLAGCNTPPSHLRLDTTVKVVDATLGEKRGADSILPDVPLPADSGFPLCAKAPCATRPIIFVHGCEGSNDDWFSLLNGLVSTDPRYDSFFLSGILDHAAWAAGSIDRRVWLFAFDYYIKYKEDGRGSYSAGPGRIGSNTSHTCSKPPGKGYLISDNSAYDAGVSHDYAADLADLVDSVLRATGASEVDMVAHSMGGLVVRSYLSFYGGASKVKRVLLLASPVKGVILAGFRNLFPGKLPDWMTAHEIAEVDAGSLLSKIHFLRCGEDPPKPGAWAAKLLEHELLHPPAMELHVMSGGLDIYISYQSAHHPLALSHQVVPLAYHSAILRAKETLGRVKQLLGGLYKP